MKIRFVPVICMASLFAASLSSASQLVDHLKAGKSQTLVVYGTSLTAGGKWVSATRTWLESINPQAKVTVINSGQSGKNSLTGLAKLDDVVIAKKPDTVIIEFAVNDAVLFPDLKQRVSVEECGKNLETMVERIRNALPETEIIVQTMNGVWDSPKGNGSLTKRPQLDAYYGIYRKTTSKLGLKLIDHHKNWEKLRAADEEKFRAYVADGVHPIPEASLEVTFPEVKRALEE
jgi:acyl-CoA thioesterase-1